MLQLTRVDGYPVTVNPDAIATVDSRDGGTLITLLGGRRLEVSESYSAVSKALGATPIEGEAGPVGFSVSG